MDSNRLTYLLQKCELLLNKKRHSEARVWLEIALDEFPTSSKLKHFAGETYLQWGMTEKAIRFLDFADTEDTLDEAVEGYDHDEITQTDLSIIQGEFNCTIKPPPSVASQHIAPSLPPRKTLTLRKKTVDHGAVKVETESICTSPSGQKQIVVKHLKTIEPSNDSETCENNDALSKETPLSATLIETGIQRNTVLEGMSKSIALTSPLAAEEFNLPRIDELHVPPEHFVAIEQSDNFERQIIFEQVNPLELDALNRPFNTEDEIIQNVTEHSDDFDPATPFEDPFLVETEGSEWTQDPTDLELYQDNKALLDFDEDDYELFDDTDDAFPSAFEDFDFDDDFVEEQQTADDECHDGNIKLTRWERAQQIAVEVIDSTNWSAKHLYFLTNVFFESGWGAARVTMEKEIRSGTTIDELRLARDFKETWKNCDRYWITLCKLGPSTNVTEATHRQMSWAQALKIIRCFNWLPSIEELEVFLDDEFEYWYQHAVMRRVFPVFMKYLIYYRAKNTPSMDFELGPYQPLLINDPMDNGDFNNCNSDIRQRLSYAGIDAITVHIP